MKSDRETIDKIVKMWYNTNRKGTNSLREALDFIRFVNEVFLNQEDREYALDKFESLIEESLNE